MQTFKDFFDTFLLSEGYKEAKRKFSLETNTNSSEILKYCDLHKKIKDLHRLKPEHSNINILYPKLTFAQFKSITDSYGQYATITKDVLKQQLLNSYIGECENYKCYKIHTPQQAYLFHGVTKWCTNSGELEKATKAFNDYTQNGKFPFYICISNNTANEFQYVAILILPNNVLLWDKIDKLYVKNVTQYDIQNCNCEFKPFRELPDDLVKIVDFVCGQN